MNIGILAFDDFTDLDLILHWDILNRVRYIAGIEEWNVKIVGTKKYHCSALGLPIPTSASIEELSKMDGVIICSGKGTRKLISDENYLAKLKLNTDKQIIGAQCSGSLILGSLGFLKGTKVSAYPPILNELQDYEAILVNKSLVEDNSIATASSCLAGQYLSNWLIEKIASKEIAAKVMQTVAPI